VELLALQEVVFVPMRKINFLMFSVKVHIYQCNDEHACFSAVTRRMCLYLHYAITY